MGEGIKKYQTIITDNDKLIFQELEPFLKEYNNEQKKAIVSPTPHILCIAGAGSGKTTVLTKKIEFLIKYRGVNPGRILAITFTRKARQEMERRLHQLNISSHVHTFNSFSEKILKLYGHKIYSRPTKTIDYSHKFFLTSLALSSIHLTMNQATEKYYNHFQKISKTSEQLAHSFMNDCFSVIEYFKLKNRELEDFSLEATPENKENTKMVYQICKHITQQMKLANLRDFTDQILDTIFLFKNFPELIPEFDYILIDEYQDVNSSQIELIDLLKPKNIFCVGDPRQSIFGWRGADISYILNFHEKYPQSEIISLKKNYRSNDHLVNIMNQSIKHMDLPDLEHNFKGEKKISLMKFDTEDKEYQFVVNKIINSKIPREEIFVLARTNKQLINLSQKLNQNRIDYILRIDELKNLTSDKPGAVTLATIHAIKGLEAKNVFIMGCNEKNFPCKASDHPVIDLIKTFDYDKEEEERRLFYVAISRAKNELYFTYTGKKPTSFITDEMLKIIEDRPRMEQQTNLVNHSKKIQIWREKKEEYKDINSQDKIENDFYNLDDENKDYTNFGKEDWEDMIG